MESITWLVNKNRLSPFKKCRCDSSQVIDEWHATMLVYFVLFLTFPQLFLVRTTKPGFSKSILRKKTGKTAFPNTPAVTLQLRSGTLPGEKGNGRPFHINGYTIIYNSVFFLKSNFLYCQNKTRSAMVVSQLEFRQRQSVFSGRTKSRNIFIQLNDSIWVCCNGVHTRGSCTL